jgi:hypothetical protein
MMKNLRSFQFFFFTVFFLLVGKSEYLCCHLIFNVDFFGLFYFGRVFWGDQFILSQHHLMHVLGFGWQLHNMKNYVLSGAMTRKLSYLCRKLMKFVSKTRSLLQDMIKDQNRGQQLPQSWQKVKVKFTK